MKRPIAPDRLLAQRATINRDSGCQLATRCVVQVFLWAYALVRNLSIPLVTVIIASGCAGMSQERVPEKIEPRGVTPTVITEPADNRLSESDARPLLIAVLSDDTHDDFAKGAWKGVQANKDKHADDMMPPKYREFLQELDDRYGVSQVAYWPLHAISAWCLVLQSEDRYPANELHMLLEEDPRIDSVQSVNLFTLKGKPNNDPYRSLQYSLNTMQVADAHRWGMGEGVSVAVVDTGVDVNHPELANQIGEKRNFVNDDDDSFSSDVHGTAISGVIAAESNNGEGIVGIAPKATLLALKACWQDTPGFATAVCSSFTLAKSLDFAIAEQADVINLSLAGPPDPLLERLVNKAISNGAMVVGAIDTEFPDAFPSYIDGVISVAELGYSGQSALTAPGSKVLSASPNGEYDFFDGSSMATAHVTGIVALIRERRPHLSAAELIELLHQTQSQTRGVTIASQGVNACRAIAYLVHSDC